MRKLYLLLALLVVCLFVPIAHCHAEYSGYVGEKIEIPMPSANYGTIETTSWIDDDPNLGVNGSIYGGATVTILKYFTGTAYVTCECELVNGTSYKEIFRYNITCKKTEITNLPRSVTLDVGEKEDLVWSWSPRSAKKPNITWESSNYSVAYVNQFNELVANGPGSITITAKNDCGDDVKIDVSVNDVPVTNATISDTYLVEVDRTLPLSVSVTPSNGTKKKVEWSVKDTDIAMVNSAGELVGVWPGTTKMWCTVNGSVKSNEAEVTVAEPAFTFKEFSLNDGKTDVDTRPTLTATYSHGLYQGDAYNDIMLTDASGTAVEGTLNIAGNTVQFTPSRHLNGLCRYTWTIPSGAVKNKWGTEFPSARSVSFTTTDWKHMTLTVSPTAKFLHRGDEIVLSCTSTEADIYYSTDGGKPSIRYDKPIKYVGDMTLRAIARQDGYYDSNELEKDYLTSVEIAGKYPGEEPIYNYADVNPSITYTYPMEKGSAFSSIIMTKDYDERVSCQLMIQGKTLYLVPTEPLENGCLYKVTIPEDALRVTDRGERSKLHEWTFATGNYSTAVSAGGPELTAALKTDGSLWTWGRRLTNGNADDGSYSYTMQNMPSSFVASDVLAVSSGYMHHAIIKRDGSLWMWGRQLCGEFGNGSREASAQPVKVMDGVKCVACGLQNTAIVKDDGTLWMCGRNDYGQIDDTRSVYTSYIKVADGVSQVQLSWGSLCIVKADGTSETRTWDETVDSQRVPEKGSLDNAAQLEYGWQNAVALGSDGSVWIWNQSSAPKEVIEGRNPQSLEGVKLLSETLTMAKGEQVVLPVRPIPLLADYNTLNWQTDDETIATISSRGIVTAVANGTTTVKAVISDAYGETYEATCTVQIGKTTGINNYVVDDWQMHVTTGHRCLYISDVPEGKIVTVYSAAGRQIFQGRMIGERMEIAIPITGIYVVRASHATKKVAVR